RRRCQRRYFNTGAQWRPRTARQCHSLSIIQALASCRLHARTVATIGAMASAVVMIGFDRSLAGPGVAIFLTRLFFTLNLHVVFEKGLVGTSSTQCWGRYQLAIGSVITQMKYGIGGFAGDTHIDVALLIAGLTDGSLERLAALGYTFPDNLRDPALMQRAM